jgi:fucose 4-O-acetylase-like acetyltransferase
MDVYLMPCLLFIAALFIFPSLKKHTTLEYLKKRFLRLCIPAVVFLFCAGDIFFQLLLTRLNSAPPAYLDTFFSYWRAFVNLPAVYLSMSQKTLNTITFNMQHAWIYDTALFHHVDCCFIEPAF